MADSETRPAQPETESGTPIPPPGINVQPSLSSIDNRDPLTKPHAHAQEGGAMATALRHAAMRLGGAWAELLPRRLVHSGARPAAAAAADGKTRALNLIKQKREELFDLIADTERRYDTRLTREGFQNTRMLQQLAVQIKPRPNDPLWYVPLNQA